MKTNKFWITAIIIIVVIALAYIYRSQIMTIFTGTPVSNVYNNTSTISVTPTSSDIIMIKSDPVKGNYLAAGDGMTLYIFDKDNPEVNNCSGNCATIWPAYTTGTTPSTLPAKLTVFTLPNGMMQYAYNKQPLYFYASDKKVGDILGDGVGGVWHLVKP